MNTNTQGKPTQFLVSTIKPGQVTPETLVTGQDFNGSVKTYTVGISVEIQGHSDPRTREAFQYNAEDIDVGDWFAQPSGKLYKIVAVDIIDSENATIEIEDVDLMVLKSDISGMGNNFPDEDVAGIIFEIDTEGMPILNGITQLSGQFPALTYWIQDIQSRFDFLYFDEEGREHTVDLNKIPNNTSGNSSSTGISITYTPFADSNVQVLVNGLNVNLGDGSTTAQPCYFSNDGGVTAKEIKDIEAGDVLYWNGIVAGYNLDDTDDIDLLYEASNRDV
jgi:hypothetical protein